MQEQQWEYLEVYLSGRHWADSTGASGELPEVSVAGYTHANSNELLDDLGAVGWELTAVLPGHYSGACKLFLKRPLVDAETESGNGADGT
jgi:hypothetical protein